MLEVKLADWIKTKVENYTKKRLILLPNLDLYIDINGVSET